MKRGNLGVGPVAGTGPQGGKMLWLLRPKDYKARARSGEWGGTPWAPIWDCTYGFIVRAGSE